MSETLILNDSERELILQLLEHELSELLPEIRRTDNASYHADLEDRKHMVQVLIDRMHRLEHVSQ